MEELRNLLGKIDSEAELDEWGIKKVKDMLSWIKTSVFSLIIKEKNARKLILKKGEIYICDFGQNLGSEENKERPCVVVQNDIGNKYAPTTIVLPISNKEARQITHLKLSDLKVDCRYDAITGTILGEQVRVVTKARIKAKIGEINSSDMEKIDKLLIVAMGITIPVDTVQDNLSTIKEPIIVQSNANNNKNFDNKTFNKNKYNQKKANKNKRK